MEQIIIPDNLQIRQLFLQADINGDGKLTPEEWLNVLNLTGIPATT